MDLEMKAIFPQILVWGSEIEFKGKNCCRTGLGSTSSSISRSDGDSKPGSEGKRSMQLLQGNKRFGSFSKGNVSHGLETDC